MDQIAHLGRLVFEVIPDTYKAYGEILSQPANRDAILKTKRTTHSYGAHPRQKLDLYEPGPNAPAPPSGRGRSVLVFAYGGGFVKGEKVLSEIPGGIAYTNMGSFFAEQLGYDVVLFDYRLAGEEGHGAKYPSGGEDVDGALKWVAERYNAAGGNHDVFLMGNSAGGAHVGTWLFADNFKSSRTELIRGASGVKLSGVIFLGAFMTIPEPMVPMLLPYYGDEDTARNASLLVLMEKAVKDASPKEKGNWPGLLILLSELDPELLFDSAEIFVGPWKEAGGQVEFQVIKGHNHISPTLALATNIEKEEAWGFDLGKWMAAQTAGS